MSLLSLLSASIMFRSHVHMKPFRHYSVCIKVKGAELSPVYYLMQQLLCELSESYMSLSRELC